MSKSDLLDVAVVLHHETERAWLVSDTGEKDKAVWVPKSQAEFDGKLLTMPEWLAIEKKFV